MQLAPEMWTGKSKIPPFLSCYLLLSEEIYACVYATLSHRDFQLLLLLIWGFKTSGHAFSYRTKFVGWSLQLSCPLLWYLPEIFGFCLRSPNTLGRELQLHTLLKAHLAPLFSLGRSIFSTPPKHFSLSFLACLLYYSEEFHASIPAEDEELSSNTFCKRTCQRSSRQMSTKVRKPMQKINKTEFPFFLTHPH